PPAGRIPQLQPTPVDDPLTQNVFVSANPARPHMPTSTSCRRSMHTRRTVIDLCAFNIGHLLKVAPTPPLCFSLSSRHRGRMHSATPHAAAHGPHLARFTDAPHPTRVGRLERIRN